MFAAEWSPNLRDIHSGLSDGSSCRTCIAAFTEPLLLQEQLPHSAGPQGSGTVTVHGAGGMDGPLEPGKAPDLTTQDKQHAKPKERVPAGSGDLEQDVEIFTPGSLLPKTLQHLPTGLLVHPWHRDVLVAAQGAAGADQTPLGGLEQPRMPQGS